MSIDRRRFLKIAGLAALAGAAPGALKASTGALARRCRITVLRCHCFSDLQSAWLDEPESGSCPMLCEGDTFEAVSSRDCPRGFCEKAWHAIAPEIDRLLGGDSECGGCREASGRGAITCCGDGTRPVIFHVELV